MKRDGHLTVLTGREVFKGESEHIRGCINTTVPCFFFAPEETVLCRYVPVQFSSAKYIVISLSIPLYFCTSRSAQVLFLPTHWISLYPGPRSYSSSYVMRRNVLRPGRHQGIHLCTRLPRSSFQLGCGIVWVIHSFQQASEGYLQPRV